MKETQRELREAWDASYVRGENVSLYPKEEVVKFMNRYVRKRTGVTGFKDILPLAADARGLDLGCGLGRHAILFEEFGLQGYGVDHSPVAIDEAKAFARHMGYIMDDRFQVVRNELPFPDRFFDVAVAEAVLDSMDHSSAKVYMAELDRVTRHLVYASFISSDMNPDHPGKCGDRVVEDDHERGTVQGYYDPQRIEDCIHGTSLRIREWHLVTERTSDGGFRSSRYHVIFSRA